MIRRARLILGVLLISVLPAPAGAHADLFGPISLVSARANAGASYEQAGEATEAVISGDGRYVAFVGSFKGVPGIWRRDLETGSVEQVAGGPAALPSISADGQYVSFTTNERLIPALDRNRGPDVYRRNMALPCTGEGGSCRPCPEGQGRESAGCPFVLVSAVNGSEAGAEYKPAPGYAFLGANELGTPEQQEERFGSLASGHSAMSEDGRYVVFETTAWSDLLREGEQSTPPLEVLVRDLDTQETKLVSAQYQPGGGESAVPVPLETLSESEVEPHEYFGAVFPGGRRAPIFAGELTRWVGASISGDGSTVAWMGQDVDKQAAMLAGEQNERRPQRAEVLWRRIRPAEPTRRVTGGSDPFNPQCAGSGERSLNVEFPSPLDPCAGPFAMSEEFGMWNAQFADPVPQLSDDGTVVAFLTDARELAGGPIPLPSEDQFDDLYVVNMASGLTRVQALRRLTEKAGAGEGETERIEKEGLISDLAISPDGSQVAFTTQRTVFPLSSPSFVSAVAAKPGMSELFDADLADDTLTRVTHGFGGEDEPSEQPHTEFPGADPYSEEQGAFSPSFSADGNTLGFTSTADNLVYGDGNGASDAFVVQRRTFPAQPVAQFVSPPPAPPALLPPWQLGVTAAARTNGSVLLYVEVPGPGSLSATARASLRVRVRAGKHHARSATTLQTRVVAQAKAPAQAGAAGLVLLTLTLSRSELALAKGAGLPASVSLSFSAVGHAPLKTSLPVTFRYAPRPAKAAKRKSRSRKR